MTDYEGAERRKINGDLAKLVGEAGAKLSILEDARTEMSGLRESVMVLAQAIALAPTAEEVEREARRNRFQTLWGLCLTLIIVAILGGLLLHGQELSRRSTQCVALQLFEHRATNQQSHDAIYDQFHIPKPSHRPLPPEPTEAQISKACGPFLRGYAQ